MLSFPKLSELELEDISDEESSESSSDHTDESAGHQCGSGKGVLIDGKTFNILKYMRYNYV